MLMSADMLQTLPIRSDGCLIIAQLILRDLWALG
jgi:hypothetical protein